MSTSLFRAQPRIVEHLRDGEIHLVFPLIDAMTDPHLKKGHLGIVLVELQQKRERGLDTLWHNWLDIHLQQLFDRFLQIGEVDMANQVTELFYKAEWKQKAVQAVETCLVDRQKAIRG